MKPSVIIFLIPAVEVMALPSGATARDGGIAAPCRRYPPEYDYGIEKRQADALDDPDGLVNDPVVLDDPVILDGPIVLDDPIVLDEPIVLDGESGLADKTDILERR